MSAVDIYDTISEEHPTWDTERVEDAAAKAIARSLPPEEAT
jgi:hypothetical protein